MRKVLVTGSRGFVGGYLRQELLRAGVAVSGFDVQDGDIVTNHDLAKDVDHVFHLAARTFVPDSWEEPYEFYRVNTLGTINVLEFCRQRKIGLTYLNTYVYGAPDRLPVSEDAPVKPNTPYNHSKFIAEDTARFYAEAYGVRVAILRAFNVYGCGQSDIFLIPSIVKQVLAPECEEVRVQTLVPRRDYVHVCDLARALVAAGRSPTGFAVFNVGSGVSRSVGEVVDCVMRLAGISKPVVCLGKDRKNEVLDIVADISHIRETLGWFPAITFEDGIAEMIASGRENVEGDVK